jgi:hypothetical protein
MGEMGNLVAGPMVHGAWVGQCPGCGTCCYFPKLRATDYAGQQVVRPQSFNFVSVLCACGRRFGTDSNSLTFVTCASLSIQRLSAESFAVAQTNAGTETNLGPMSEIELWNYLNSRTLIDIIPSQVLMFLSTCKALDMDMVVSVVRPPEAMSASVHESYPSEGRTTH